MGINGRPAELVIFDCDGVLVDSERLAVKVDIEVLAALGWNLSEAEVVARFVGASEASFREQVEALDRIPLPSCVASSGSHDKMRFTLGLTGLYERFRGRIFSATEVARGKPAPDIFLYAAERMAAPPETCVVVEDSAKGVAAACAAGMRVLAYAGGVTPAAKLAVPGAVVFDDMRDLPSLLGP
jgi:HAD superfamily hydrolase (TIGR01509 family)